MNCPENKCHYNICEHLRAKLADAYEAHKHEQEMRQGLEQKLALAVGALERTSRALKKLSECEEFPGELNFSWVEKTLTAINGGNVAAIDPMTKDDHENTLLDEYPYADYAERPFKMSDKDFMKGRDK